MQNWLGDELQKQEELVPSSALDSVKLIGLYFSASWCHPCRIFTKRLTDFYHHVNTDGKKFEVVFLSNDYNEEDFTFYYRKMPWLAVPYHANWRVEYLARILRPPGLPTLYIMTKDLRLVSSTGTSDINNYGYDAYKRWLQVSEGL